MAQEGWEQLPGKKYIRNIRCSLVASAMAAVRRLRVSVKSDSGTDQSESDSDSESDRDVREAEPMEVEEGELESEDISVNRSLKELLPVSLQTKAFSDPVFWRRDYWERSNM